MNKNESRYRVPAKSETGKGFIYCLNQEKHLRLFLTNGNIPIDNNATEVLLLEGVVSVVKTSVSLIL